ncbi:MAG TPA: hypothetical protein VF398_10200 [bacterium]|jgi:hypothetical protein
MQKLRSWGMGLATLLLLATIGRGQDSLNVTKIGELILHTGEVFEVAVSGGTAYWACGSGLVITNDSPPLQVIGSYPVQNVAVSVAVSGRYAYVSETLAGVRVLDVSDPASPFEVGIYPTPYGGADVEVSGNYA